MSSNSTSTDKISLPTDLYGYVPTFWICCTFIALFGLTTIMHLVEALFFKPRLYWLIPTMVMCGVGEIVGWSGRLWSSKNPFNENAYTIQVTTTIISPIFLTAGLYTILGVIINIMGFQYSRLNSKTYLKIFVTADVLALLVQAGGGGISSSTDNDSQARLGAHVMLAGVGFQLAAMLCYTLLASEFLLRLYFQKPLRKLPTSSPSSEFNDKAWLSGNKAVIDGYAFLPPRIGLMVVGLALATVLVFIRTIYRTVELIGGFNGHVIRTQVFFNALDATPIVLALLVLNFLAPTFLLRNTQKVGMA